MSFYAYSPIAGGSLVKDSAILRSNNDTGRFSPEHPLLGIYSAMYNKESFFDALNAGE
jgi:aflatoxin B1 aldehyde reductase